MIDITDSSFFENYRCTNVTCPHCGAKGSDDNSLTITGMELGSDIPDWMRAEYLCFKCGQYFSAPMDYDVEEVVIKKKIYHLKNNP